MLQALRGATCEDVDCLAELAVDVECPLSPHLMEVEEAWDLAHRLALVPGIGIEAVPKGLAGLLSQAGCIIDPVAAGPWAFVANAYREAVMVSDTSQDAVQAYDA